MVEPVVDVMESLPQAGPSGYQLMQGQDLALEAEIIC